MKTKATSVANARHETLLTSGLILISVTLLTKLVAFTKEILIAAQFGVSETTDAFIVAFTIPNVLLFLLGIDLIKGTSTSIFSSYLANGKIREFSQVFSSIFNLTFIFTAAVLAIGIWQMPFIISLIAPTFSGTQLSATIGLARILLSILMFMGLANYVIASLNALRKFFVPALATLTANLIVVFFLLFASRQMGIYSIAWGYCTGFATSLIILLWYASKTSLRYEKRIISNVSEVQSFIRKSSPLLILTTFSQVNVLVEKSIASRLDVGGISALSFAHKLSQMAIDICIVPILTVLLPTLSGEFSLNQKETVSRRISKGTEIICLILIPISIIVALLSKELVGVVFERGVFDNSDTLKTSSALIFYAIGLLPHGLYLFFITNYLAMQETLSLGKIGAVASCINIALNLILIHYFEYLGIALAWSISSFFYLIMLMIVSKKKLMLSNNQIRATPYFRIFVSGVLMGVSIYFMKELAWLDAGLLRLLSITAVGLLLYLVFLLIFGIRQPREGLIYLKRRMKSFGDCFKNA